MGWLSRYLGFMKGALKAFSMAIAFVINSILLGLVYLIGVGITSIMARIIGKHFLEVNKSKKESYWHELNLKKKTIEEYYRQF